MADKVLLVEDERLLRKIVKNALERDGLDVVEASNGEEAIRLIDAGQSFDALATDVQLHGQVNGIEVAEHARAVHPEVPVVIMSGSAWGGALIDMGDFGALLNKPFRLAALVSVIRNLLSAHKTASRKR